MPRFSHAYISGPLQSAPDLSSARSFYEQLAAVCIECGVAAYVPHQTTDPEFASALPPRDVFRRDFHALKACDVIIAAIGVASSGVGAEIGIACTSGTPVIAVWQASQRPSRFVRGLLESTPSATCIQFTDIEDCCSTLRRVLLASDLSCPPEFRLELTDHSVVHR